ncbi:CotH kinase family protein [Myxococcota bacterium]
MTTGTAGGSARVMGSAGGNGLRAGSAGGGARAMGVAGSGGLPAGSAGPGGAPSGVTGAVAGVPGLGVVAVGGTNVSVSAVGGGAATQTAAGGGSNGDAARDPGGMGLATGGMVGNGDGRSVVASGGEAMGAGGSLVVAGGSVSGGTDSLLDPEGSGPGSGGSSPAACPPACGPDTESFYDNNKLSTLRITFDPADVAPLGYTVDGWLDLLWARWKHCPPFDNLVRITMEYESPDGVGDGVMTDVGMRLRGSWERDTTDLQGFKLEFQGLLGVATGAARRRFGDINRLNTLSIERDPSHLVQCLAYKTMRDFGIPAPMCNHLMVYVNDQYYGLMENVEEADHGRFLAHHFGTTEGLLVEVSPSGCGYEDRDGDLAYLGSSFSAYADPPKYKLERGTEAEAEASLFPMFKCADATQTPDDLKFKTCIQEWLDVGEWLRVMAAESLMPTLESLMYKRNFYLYFHPDPEAPHGGRFLVYSWDLDTAFQRQSCYPSSCDPMRAVSSLLGPTGARPQLVSRLSTVFKTEYCETMREFLSTVYQPRLVDDMAQVIEPGMASDPITPIAEWQAEITAIRDFITSHKAEMQSQIASVCN